MGEWDSLCFAGIRRPESSLLRISPVLYRTIILTALNAILIVDSSWWAGYWAHPWFSNYCSSPLSPYNSKSRACSRCRQVVNLGVWSQRCSGAPHPMLVAPGGGGPWVDPVQSICHVDVREGSLAWSWRLHPVVGASLVLSARVLWQSWF